jgi:hypothetical protein
MSQQTSADAPTVRDYVRGWVQEHFSEEDPIEDRGNVVERILARLRFRPSAECTDGVRAKLTETIHEPRRTLEEILKDELAGRVDEEFAALIAPFASEYLSTRWDFPEGPTTQIPYAYGTVLRDLTRQTFEEGAFGEYIQAYKRGELKEHLS